ncbi:hypothetical protein RAS1_06990 [Phycisphaerae bacterium RAS1]|nr:hypothetical protein RAS1_06990 [Phycisphaerae bacterium RAS1]
MLQEACEIVFSPNKPLALRVVARDAEVDAEEVAVEAEVIRLVALYQPVGVDLRLLFTVLKVTTELERVADCAVNIAERAKHLEVQQLAPQNEHVRQMCTLVRRVLRQAVTAYSFQEVDVARQVAGGDAEIDALFGAIVREVLASATRSPESLAGYLDILSVTKNLERIADHATNIAEDVIYLATGAIVRHRNPGD